MASEGSSAHWYGVRCVVRWIDPRVFEERITVWLTASADEAILMAEEEASAYAARNGLVYLELAQSYLMATSEVVEGTEVFSLLRESDLDTETYLDTFFDTGTERQSHWPDLS
jgi:2-methylcitrate dehydratase PrpD